MVSPQLVSVTHHLLDFNRRSSEPLGILPQLPITLGGKIICIDVMVIQGLLDFNLVIGWDYVYAMKVVVSTLFQVTHFPHNGNIVTIEHLSFVSPDLNVNHLTSLNVPYMKVIYLLAQVNYVVSCPMSSTTNEKEPVIVFSTSLDSYLVVDMVNPSMGSLEHDISPVTPIESLDIHSFQSIFLPSNEDLLESMVKVHEHSSLYVSRSLKIDNHEHSSFPVSSSLKTKTYPPQIESILPLDLVPEPPFPMLVSVDPLSSSLSGQPIPMSSQESNQVQKKSRWTK
jgi:hypothetical protein